MARAVNDGQDLPVRPSEKAEVHLSWLVCAVPCKVAFVVEAPFLRVCGRADETAAELPKLGHQPQTSLSQTRIETHSLGECCETGMCV